MEPKTKRAVAIIVACLLTIVGGGAYLVNKAAGPAAVSQVRSAVYAPATDFVPRSNRWRDEIKALDESRNP